MAKKLVYLNSYISETFINVSDNKLSILKNDNCDICELYVNSHKVIIKENEQPVNISCNNGLVRIYINPTESKSHNILIDTAAEQYEIKYTPILFNEDEIINSISNNNDYVNNDTCSFMLLRTNPKLSGNIKLVIDSSNNMYLDTFKVNKTLSNKKYRKAKISTDGIYSNDIRNIFGDIPSKDLYDIPELGKKHAVKYDVNEQYVDTYFYGVKNNFDKLYSENFSFLAPLWINKKLPDFFVIFRLDEIFDNHELTPEQSFNNIIKNGKIVKYYDLRKNSIIGNYLRNAQKDLHNYMHSTDITYNNMNFNKWHGISVRNGIITSVDESTYEINSRKNQVEHDAYITLGYERHDLINPYLINFEFMFNDNIETDVDNTFKIKRYIGLYLINNDIESFYKFDDNTYNKNFELINLPEFNNEIASNYIVNVSSYTKNNEFIRLQSSDDIKNMDNLANTNIATLEKLEYLNSDEYVMHINIHNPLECGEHIRIIDASSNSYWEIEIVSSTIKTSDTLSNDKKNELLDYKKYYTVYNQTTHNMFNNVNGYSNICVGYSENDSAYNSIKNNNSHLSDEELKKEIIKEQIYQIVSSFNDMENKSFIISNYTNDTISFLSTKELKFEYIQANTSYNNQNIAFFDNIDIPTIQLDLLRVDILNNLLYHNAHEITNDRFAQIVNFCKLHLDDIINGIPKCFVIPESEHNKILKSSLVRTKTKYKPLNKYKIKYFTDIDNKIAERDILTIKHPYNNNYLINFNLESNEIDDTDKIYIYESALLNLCIAGYLPIKDFNFNLLDTLNDTKYGKTYSEENFISKHVKAAENVTLNYDTHQYKVYKGVVKNNDTSFKAGDIIPRNINTIKGVDKDSIIIEYHNDASLFKYGPIINKPFEPNINLYDNYSLITPYVCKWELNGLDVFGNKIKATNQNNLNNDISSYYLSDEKFNDMIGWYCYRYINDNDFYVFNDINDIIKCDNHSITLHDNIIYNNGNIIQLFRNDKNNQSRFSTLYYNYDENCLETIIFGKKLNIASTNNLIDLSKYNNYIFTIICSSGSNMNNNRVEYIIDEKMEIMTCIYYTETYNTALSYKKEYSICNIYDSSGYIDTDATIFKKFKYDFDFSNIINDKYLPFINKKDDNFIINNDISLFISAININQDKQILLYDDYTYLLDVKADSIKPYGIDCNNNNILVSYDCYDINGDISYTLNDESFNGFYKSNNTIYEYVIGDTVNKYTPNISFNDIKNNESMVYIKGDTLKTYNNILSLNEVTPEELITNDKILFYYSYKCNPEFIDILSFNNNLNEISKFFNKDLCFSNISVNNVNKIKNLFINTICNKVFKKHNNSLDYKLLIKDYDITKCYWSDIKFSKIYITDDITQRQIKPGYSLSSLKSMFMGGVGLIINTDSIDITEWDDCIIKKSNVKSFNNSDDSYIKSVYHVNIKKALKQQLSYNDNLNNNWNDNKYVIPFIENVLFSIFDINNKNNIKIYKSKNDNVLSNNTFKLIDNYEYEEIKNIKISFIEDGIFEIEIPEDDYQYAIKYIIKK